MISPDTMDRREATRLEATDELPALDVAAYEAEAAVREAVARPESANIATGSDGSATQPPEDRAADPVPRVAEADMLEIERWIVQKTEELRAQQAALRAAQRERSAGAARADALSRELGATTADLEALHNRARILEDELRGEREGAQRRTAQLDGAQREAARLGAELTAARAAEAEHSAALAASAALLQQRSDALETLQATHAALVAERQRAADELAELQGRLEDSEARERLAAAHELLQAQLASCVEQLQNREAYRAIFQSTIGELDGELAGATLRAGEQEARANQLAAELEASERGRQDALRERDEARRSHDTALAQQAIEREASEQTRSALESQLTELTTEHANARARLLAMEAALADTERRAEAEALANATAAERGRRLEAETAALERELVSARLEIAGAQAALSDLAAALERSRTMLAEQTRVLEERESMARSMATSHAELEAVTAALRGQIEELTARLATPAEERRALEERVAALTQEAAESHSRLVRLEAMNVELRATVKQLDASLAERDAELQKARRIASTNAYALGRMQSSINELTGGLNAADGPAAETQASILTRIDGSRNHSFVLRARTTIGRNPDNDLALTMGSVSRHHAVLIPASRSAFLQDLGSTNGVLVNKRRVRCARLEHGDVITLGEAQFRYTVAPAAAVSGSQVPLRRRAQR